MNILKHIVSLIFLIFGNLVLADSHYVRACNYNGDGSSADCAVTTGGAGPWDAFKSIDWQSIEPSDTLYIIGEHNEELIIKKSGTKKRKITINGNKRGYDKGIINGNGDIDICVYDNDSSNNLRFTHLEVTGCTKRGFYFRNGMNISNFSGITLHDVYVHDIMTNNGPQDGTCVWGYGKKLSVIRSRFDNCSDDSIWIRGKRAKISHNTMKKIGTGDKPTGDCVQLSGNSTKFVIKNNYCDHSSNPEKQCFIVNTEHDETAGGEIIDNVCLMGDEKAEMNSNGIYNNQDNVIIARNFVHGSRQSIWNTTNSNTIIVSNVLTAFDGYGIVNVYSDKTMSINNTVVGKNHLGVCIYSYHASGQFTNNILTSCSRPIKANGAGYNSWDYNLIWDTENPTPYFINEAVGENEVYTSINEDPLFDGEALDDPYSFIISPDGPAYHSGNILESGSAFKIDNKHNVRPNPPSVGAFEP